MRADLDAAIADVLPELLTPALVIDLDAVEHNIARLKTVIGKGRWRPHIKTLKQSRLVQALMRKGISSFKCATLDELALVLDTAERVHPEGIVDVVLAYPATSPMLAALPSLLEFYEGGKVQLLADSPEHARFVVDALEGKLPRPVGLLLDVDLGMHRTGSAPPVWQEALDTLPHVKQLPIVGLHGYAGHLSAEQVHDAHAAYDELVDLAKALGKATKLVLTSGSDSFQAALEHPGLAKGRWTHQVGPGTLVLCDTRSSAVAEPLGLRQAAFVASRVIARPPGRITIDAGSKSLAPDIRPPACTVLDHAGLRDLRASEEHRPLAVDAGEAPRLGSVLWLVPAHVCTTVNLYRQVIYVRGPKRVGKGPVEAMSRTLMVSDQRP